MSDKIELLPCPFCGIAARLESNHDWHRIIVDHDEACIFLEPEVSMVPATDDQLSIVVADWNRRAALSQHPAPSDIPEPDQCPTDAMLDDMRRRGLSIDGNNAYKRDLIDCIIGTLMLGKQGSNPPPAGHWAQQFWEMARAEGEIQESLAAASAAAPAPRNNHGVDAHYFHRKLSLVLRDFESLTPDELARTLARLAKVADEKVLAEREFAPAPAAQEPAEVYAVRYLSHWDGEGDDVYVLAWRHDGELVAHESGVKISDLLEYQGDKILNVWPLYTAPPAAEQPDIVREPQVAG